jgi:O-antigen/teichoic acid export membrane protein
MSRTRRLLNGVGLHYAGQVLITLVGLWITPFILYHIGQRDYGLWLVGYQLLTYLMLADLGLVAVLPRSLATATGLAANPEEAAAEVAGLLGQTCRLILWQMPLVAGAALAVWASLPAEWQALREPLGAVMVAYVLLFPFRLFQAALQGLQDLAFVSAAQTGTWFVNTALSLSLVWAGEGLGALAWSWIVSQGVLHLLCGLRLWGRFPNFFPRRLAPPDWQQVKGRLQEGFWASLAQVAVALLNSTDVILIGTLIGPEAVVPYVCTAKLVFILGNHAQAALQFALPALAEVRASQTPGQVLGVCNSMTTMQLLLSGLVGCLVLAVNPGFVTWWVGGEQFGGWTLNCLLLVLMVLRHWNIALVFSIFAFGYNRRIPLTTILDGLVTLTGSALLIPQVGLIGAPIGSVLGVCFVSLPLNLSAFSMEMGIAPWKVLAAQKDWLWRVGVLALACGVLASVWTPTRFFAITGTALTVAAIYLFLMFPLFRRPPLGWFLQPIWNSLRNKLFLLPRPGGVEK